MNIKYIRLTEIVIWLILLSCGLYFFIYNSAVKDNVMNSYYIFFDDAGGLVKGSPVRLMGINIGYVRDVKIFDNKVFVSFLVTKEGIAIPKHAFASIEFYGLGCSASLELKSASAAETDEVKELISSKAYRIQDYWDGAELAANVMIDIYGGIGRTIRKTNLIQNKDLLKQSALLRDFLNQSHDINTAQSVIIYKLTKNTLPYIDKKNKEALENIGDDNIKQNEKEAEKDE